jgi:predicted nucleic acid-binding Zn ribbon protein
MTRKGPLPLAADLERYLASLGIPQVSLLVSLHRSWPGIAGPLLSSKAAPSRFRNGVLTITVRNHSWAQELQMCKPVLLSKIVEATGPKSPVTDLRFSVGPLPPPEEEPGGPPELPADPAAPEPEGLSEISDPEMRESLRAISRRQRLRNT